MLDDFADWEPRVQYGFSKVPVVQKTETALHWVNVRLRVELERINRQLGIGAKK